MQKILMPAEESLDRVMDFFRRQGTPLSYRPRLQYVDALFNPRPSILALSRVEIQLHSAMTHFITSGLLRTAYKEVYGLSVSNEALEEIVQKIEPRFQSSVERYADADIFIFKPYNEHIKTQRESDKMIAHEYWHLVEDERRVLKPFLIIKEGTAVYAEARFAGERCDIPMEDMDSLLGVTYQGAANIVQKHVESAENPYLAMLDASLRTAIQQEFMLRLQSVFVRTVMRMFDDETQRGSMMASVKELPEFRALIGNLTPEGVVQAYRKMGADKFANELQTQDLTTMLNWFRKAGF